VHTNNDDIAFLFKEHAMKNVWNDNSSPANNVRQDAIGCVRDWRIDGEKTAGASFWGWWGW